MSVLLAETAKIRDGRFIRHITAALAGDATAGSAIVRINIPRTFRLLRAWFHVLTTQAANYQTPYCRFISENEVYDVGWTFKYRDEGNTFSEYVNDNLPIWAMHRSGEAANQTGVYMFGTNGNTYTWQATMIAEVEKVDDTLRNAQQGGWSPRDFWQRLDRAIFGEKPGRFSTP